MKTEIVNINLIQAAPYNPRIISEGQMESLKRSISEFEVYTPLIVNQRTNYVVGGNQRLAALKGLGHNEVHVIYVDLSDQQEKALNLALNKISGDWDDEKLAHLLNDLKSMPDFDISLTGFDAPEISSLFDRYLKEGGEDTTTDLHKPEIPITKSGDLIILGPHRILCGDSSKVEDVNLLLNGQKANLIHMDPPYNVAYDGGARPIPQEQRSNSSEEWNEIQNDNLPQADYETWLKKVFANMALHTGAGAAFYVWNGHRQFGPMYQMLTAQGFHISCVITWAKERFALGYGDYNQQTEFCLYGWKEDNGAHNWYGPSSESTLWQINRDAVHTYNHPTQKPVALAERAIKNSSTREDLVLDLFLGSGTTLIAAEQLGRRCYGMELDPGYCDVIVKRYINLVGVDMIPEEIKVKYLQEKKHE